MIDSFDTRGVPRTLEATSERGLANDEVEADAPSFLASGDGFLVFALDTLVRGVAGGATALCRGVDAAERGDAEDAGSTIGDSPRIAQFCDPRGTQHGSTVAALLHFLDRSSALSVTRCWHKSVTLSSDLRITRCWAKRGAGVQASRE